LSFFILNFDFKSKKTKKALKSHNKNNKFYILDKTKHNYKIFGILYFIIIK